jgi:hypothetical protein
LKSEFDAQLSKQQDMHDQLLKQTQERNQGLLSDLAKDLQAKEKGYQNNLEALEAANRDDQQQMQRKNKDLLDKLAKDATDRDGLYV